VQTRIQGRRAKIRIIGISVITISLLYYLTSLSQPLYQEISTRLFYLPIFLGGLWFGFAGGLRVSLAVTIACLPYVLRGVGREGSLFYYDELLELALFNLIGPLVGILSAREQSQKARNQELQTLALLGEGASAMAHEMKNVVIPIRGLLRRIHGSRAVEGKAAEYLEIAERESARLEKMIQDILSFVRHTPPRREEVEVRALLEELRQTFDTEFGNREVRLLCLCAGTTGVVMVDRERIRQVISNLLHNALQASPKGKEVRVIADCNDRGLQIVVEDDGEGIPKEHMDRVFLAFFTTKPKGTGLGLSVAKQIVEEHGGTIRCERGSPGGTRVVVDLPAE
jgi:two-component system sensor histidine kinase HydH